MADLYFMLMTDDHRQAKNKTQEELRNEVREIFNQGIVENRKGVAELIDYLIIKANAAHPRSNPIVGQYWNREHYPSGSDCYYVDGLFQLVFYKVKEVDND